MSFNLMAWAIKQKLPAPQKCLLLVLANRADDETHECWPSNSTLADEAGMSVRSVITNMNELVKAGIVEKTNRSNGFMKTSSMYRLVVNSSKTGYADSALGSENSAHCDMQNMHIDMQDLHGGSENSALGVVKILHGGSENSAHETIIETINKNQSIKQSSAPAIRPARKQDVSDEVIDLRRQTWKRFCDSYFARYGVDPVRNAKSNKLVCDLVTRIGGDAPFVAEFYLSHNDSYFVRCTHDIGLLVQRCESLRTQWATSRKVTSITARETERTGNTLDLVNEILAGNA